MRQSYFANINTADTPSTASGCCPKIGDLVTIQFSHYAKVVDQKLQGFAFQDTEVR